MGKAAERCREMLHLGTDERGEPLTEASIDPAIAMEACRCWTEREGEKGREEQRSQ